MRIGKFIVLERAAKTGRFALKHARTELERAGMFKADSDYGGMLGPAIMKMCEVFASEGHSGGSAAISAQIFNLLAKYEPLTPLTGEADEWNEIGEGVFQNRRCSRVFKENGEAYDINGKVFREPNGASYTSRESRVPVTFPYTPRTEFVDTETPPVDGGGATAVRASWNPS